MSEMTVEKNFAALLFRYKKEKAAEDKKRRNIGVSEEENR
jgi:hypothetical protein